MRIKLWHIGVFVLALLVFAAAGAPPSLFAPQRPGVFTYERAQGTVWSARLEGVRFSGYEIDALTWRIKLWDVLNGKIVAPVHFEGGDINGDATVLANWQGDRRLVAQSLRLSGVPLGRVLFPGETQISDLDVFFDAGSCSRASGRISSDVVEQAGRALHFAGAPLAGAVSCEEKDAVVRLSGENASAEAVSALIRLRGDGAGEWRLAVQTASSDGQAALAAAGFQLEAGAGDMVRSGGLRWLTL